MIVLGRFLGVGLACAVLHNIIMIAGDYAGLHYAVSSVLSFAIVVCFGYWLHSGWTFAGAERGSGSFARYASVASANLPLSIAGMYLGVDVAHLEVPVATPIVTVALMALNFAGSRWALRRRRRAA